ncbi:hypothetical protein PR202_ga26233 [Eleusine coracana subsp. coracana]|uniref:Uncharacterized protein n=1 Tax=Eleusine coracana subsp. coracana TaxID=191504 RepID=A0AAV5DD40_ELECO|nr:hypothetical protein PR202_ga26233 [Eleusine coracana subsp. coracana]
MLPKWKAAEGGGGGCAAGGGGGDQRRRCVAASLSMLIAATLAFLAYVAFFPDDGAGGLYRLWRCQDCAGDLLGEFPGDAAAADGPTPAGGRRRPPTTLSHVVFGIGASARTWDQRRGYAELWWRPGQMRGHVWLDEEPVGPAPWPAATCPPYRVSANASRFGDRASASRMARIVADSFLAVTAELRNNYTAAAREDEVRWFVMGDDDTVFFPDNLVSVLNKYDHEELYYVGAPSESVEQDVMHSYGMAFGGGGFAVSYPAAAALAKAIDGCLERYRWFYGSDQRVQACLSELGVPLTREPGFHQVNSAPFPSFFVLSKPRREEGGLNIDVAVSSVPATAQRLVGATHHLAAQVSGRLFPVTKFPRVDNVVLVQVDVRGDAYGMLAAHPVAPLVSLHHLDHIQPISPRGKTALDAVRPLVDASRYDPARALQQSFCYQHGPGGYTWSVSVAWGYTVQVYPWAVAPHELEVPLQTFRTWRSWADGPFVFNTRKLSPDDACARPAMFFLSRVRNETARSTVTEYARHDATPAGKVCDKASFRAASMVHTVKVFAPNMSESDWVRAPRRQCCKTRRTRWGSVLEVRIRRCGRGELTTP